MKKNVLAGKRALVTGASSGLGADFARQLAERARHPVDVEVIPMDLGTPEAPAKLHALTRKKGLEVDVLVNNAGFGLYGEFLDLPWDRERDMIQIDILTLVHLTKLYARDMAERKSGWILQVSSIGAFQATPTYASYSAAKAFVLSFGEAVGYELQAHGIKSSVICPGITATEFLKVSGQKATPYQRLVMMESPEVVRIGIEAMLKGTPSVVPGAVNAATAWSTRLSPRKVNTALAYKLMKS
jgi:hypothetical protein